ncbi:MAG: DUF3866 family protein [Actinomycetota bacterium]
MAGPEASEAPEFAGREAGHILKLRYTPLQLRVLSAEEEASPHRAAVQAFRGLERTPVLAAELLSQAGAAAIAARATSPAGRIVLVHLDSAALPIAFSRLVARLQEDGVLNATVTVGQSFGGDYEAVNIYSGLVVAKAVARADLIIVSQGPGNVGTGTRLGFSGLALVEALHAAAFLDGAPILAPRMSEGDGRDRHRGVSHHTGTILEALRVSVHVPFPTADSPPTGERHPVTAVDPAPAWAALDAYRDALTTMGRSLEEDRLFFQAAAAAGIFAARQAETSHVDN